MAKIKKDIIVFGETYKNIDVYEYRTPYDVSIYIDTTGIAQIIKQYIKNKYGDIKVWAKSSKYSMGSRISVYLWNVPREWFLDIKEFADRFGKYIDYSSGDPDGNFYGKNVNATLIDGTKIENDSPYINVDNKPPYDSKEYDMTPPNYEDMPKTTKKEYQRKGGKYSPTDNLDLVLDCGNGWKIYVGKPKEKYLYNVVKDKDTKQNKEQWAEIKADMLEAGFMWGYKSGTFQRWTTMPDDTIPQKACDVLSKYWGGASQPKEETPKEPQILLPQGTAFELIEADSIFTKGETGVLAEDFYEGNTYVEAYMNSESRPDYPHFIRFAKIKVIEEAPREEIPEEEILPFVRGEIVKLKMPFTYNNSTYPEGLRGEIKRVDYVFKTAYVYFYGDDSGNYPVPFEYLEKFVDKYETPKEEGKIPLVKIVDVWGQFGTPNKEFTNFEDLEKEFFQTEIPAEGYDKYKFKFEWADGSYIMDRIDVGYSGSDFNPSVRTFEDYVDYLYNTSSEKISVFYEYEMKEPFNKYSTKFSNEAKEETPKEVNLDEYINDLNVLLEMDDNESRRLELATYISDLNTLKLLQ